MRRSLIRQTLVAAVGAITCSACISTGGAGSGLSLGDADWASGSSAAGQSSGQFGDSHSVQATIDTIKAEGDENRLGSRALRLPEQPLGAIAAFSYQFPAQCGGHEFSVYEAEDMQILEYELTASDGGSHLIRDYVTGPSPFVKPGLWTAYDHTADSVSNMTSQFDKRGGVFEGMYSQGLVTGLSHVEQRELGGAYQRALSDVYGCRTTEVAAAN